MMETLGSFEGKYEILERIGGGGMGLVYKVRHRLLNEIRVIKTMRSHLMNQDESRQRFFREARIAAKARHENIAQIFDFAVDEDVAFLVMEYIDGVTLEDVLAEKDQLSLPLALEVAQQSLRALAFVHSIGIIHRDISPDNLMLTTDRVGRPKVKMIDLGLAKLSEVESGLTREGFFLGKLRYASPEQFDSQSGVSVGPWSDVYSFGLVLYELLTGHYPIRGRDMAELMAGHIARPPLAFSESDTAQRVPEDLRQVVLRSLEKSPNVRFSNGGDFRDHILPIQGRFPCGNAEWSECLRLCQRSESETLTIQPGSGQKAVDRAFRPEDSSEGGRLTTDSRRSEDAIAAELDTLGLVPASETPPPAPISTPKLGATEERPLERGEMPAKRPRESTDIPSVTEVRPGLETPVPGVEPETARSEKRTIQPVESEVVPPGADRHREAEELVAPPPPREEPPEPPEVQAAEREFEQPDAELPTEKLDHVSPPPVDEAPAAPDAPALKTDEPPQPPPVRTGEPALPPPPASSDVAGPLEIQTPESSHLPRPPAESEAVIPAAVAPDRPAPVPSERKPIRAAVAPAAEAAADATQPMPPVAKPGRPTIRNVGLMAAAVIVLATLAALLNWLDVVPIPGLGQWRRAPVVATEPGTLVINALPWAEVVEITDENGRAMELERASFTPLALSIAPGKYSVRLRHEYFGERTLTATVRPGESVTRAASFAEIEQDDLLRSLNLIQ